MHHTYPANRDSKPAQSHLRFKRELYTKLTGFLKPSLPRRAPHQQLPFSRDKMAQNAPEKHYRKGISIVEIVRMFSTEKKA